MLNRTLGVLLVSVLVVGCEGATDDEGRTEGRVGEIIDNLIAAGYSEDAIDVVDVEDPFSVNGVEVLSAGPQVYVDGDTHVTLEASRALLGAEDDEDAFRLWRTPGLVNNNTTICLAAATSWIPGEIGPPIYGLLSTDMIYGLVYARDNYNALASMNLQFEARDAQLGINGNLVLLNQTGCTYVIGVARSYYINGVGGSSGFPSGNGAPYGMILANGTADNQVFEHMMTHEIGHCIGLRHSDWKTRSSCGQNSNEGQLGASQIPGTVDQTTNSIMGACNPPTDGEFRGEDGLALNTLY